MDVNGKIIVDDVVNAVKDYCADGFDAIEEVLATELAANGMEHEMGCLHECLETLYSRLQASVDDGLARFEEFALSRVFYVPEGLEAAASVAKTTMPETEMVNVEEEEALDKELDEMRRRIAVARGASSAAREEIHALETELSHWKPAIAQIRAMVEAGKHNENDAAQIAVLQRRLSPLMERAEKLRRGTQLMSENTGKAATGIGESQVHQQQLRAGGVSAGALKDLQNIITQ